MNISLCDDKISDYGILILDVMTPNNKWYSETIIDNEKKIDYFQNSRVGVGLVNIGNSKLTYLLSLLYECSIADIFEFQYSKKHIFT